MQRRLRLESRAEYILYSPVRSRDQLPHAKRCEINFVGLEKETVMLWTVLVVLLILWLLGFSLHIGGGLIHLLLVVGLVVLVINLVSGRRSVG
jgi:hypothetical protein